MNLDLASVCGNIFSLDFCIAKLKDHLTFLNILVIKFLSLIVHFLNALIPLTFMFGINEK